jgi:1-acyl-sn-glycerol-3-phosphate acyltransferase
MIFFFVCFWIGKIVCYVPMSILWPTKVVGRRNLPRNSKVIVVCNHLSWVDILILWFKIPGFRRFLAKKEVGSWYSKWLTCLSGTIFIDRQGSDIKAIKKCINVLNKGQSLNLFPEGTRNRVDTNLQQIQSGVSMLVLKSGATVVPVIIRDKAKMLRRNVVCIGQPLTFPEFGGKFNRTNSALVLDRITQSMIDTQVRCRAYE